MIPERAGNDSVDEAHAPGWDPRLRAGGAATTHAILDPVPSSLHQRVPLAIGSRVDVEEYAATQRAPETPGV